MKPAARRGNPGLFVISGPSGSGKTTLIRRLKGRPELFYSVSVTTRQPRAGEEEGRDYHFVSRAEFERMAAGGEFAESAEVAGNLYGTPKGPLELALSLGRRALVDIDVQGAMQIKGAFPEATLVFVEPPSMEELERRLRNRGTESEESIRRRLELARREMLSAPAYDFRVVNDRLERAVGELENLVLCEEK